MLPECDTRRTERTSLYPPAPTAITFLADGGLDSFRPIVQVQEVWAGPSVVGYDSVFPYDLLADRSRAVGVVDVIVYPFYERR